MGAQLALLGGLIAGTVYLFWHPLPFPILLAPLMGLMVVLWLVSLRLKDASIIDIFWGPAFALVAVFALGIDEGPTEPRDLLLIGLVTVWALRLGIHIGVRNAGKGEDKRYRRWREEAGGRWWWQSLLQVFVLQGLLVWLISSPLVASIHLEAVPGLFWLDWVGVALWLIGFGFEAIGDWQLSRFKADPDNRGKVMDRGLWSLTRHPNYFGDAVLWWGYACFAVTVGAFEFLFAPVLMTLLLLKVSGVSLLEGDLKSRKPGYADYVERVPAFFPRLPAALRRGTD